MAKKQHKQMDHTSAAQAKFLDSLRERAKKKYSGKSFRGGRGGSRK